MSTDKTYYQAQEYFVHRKVADTDVLISVAANVANFNGYITLNPTAPFEKGILCYYKVNKDIFYTELHT